MDTFRFVNDGSTTYRTNNNPPVFELPSSTKIVINITLGIVSLILVSLICIVAIIKHDNKRLTIVNSKETTDTIDGVTPNKSRPKRAAPTNYDDEVMSLEELVNESDDDLNYDSVGYLNKRARLFEEAINEKAELLDKKVLAVSEQIEAQNNKCNLMINTLSDSLTTSQGVMKEIDKKITECNAVSKSIDRMENRLISLENVIKTSNVVPMKPYSHNEPPLLPMKPLTKDPKKDEQKDEKKGKK